MSKTRGEPSTSTNLKEVLSEKIPVHHDLLRKFRFHFGSRVVSQITVEDLYGGLSGVKTIVRETSELDPKHGVMITKIYIKYIFLIFSFFFHSLILFIFVKLYVWHPIIKSFKHRSRNRCLGNFTLKSTGTSVDRVPWIDYTGSDHSVASRRQLAERGSCVLVALNRRRPDAAANCFVDRRLGIAT